MNNWDAIYRYVVIPILAREHTQIDVSKTQLRRETDNPQTQAKRGGQHEFATSITTNIEKTSKASSS